MSKSKLIPEQHKGLKVDTTSVVKFNTETDAKAHFEVAKKRLLDLNNWKEISGWYTASFELIDSEGKKANRYAIEGDYFKIDIPGPGPKAGDGYDWVRIQTIESSTDKQGHTEYIAIKVHPSADPLNKETDTSHFFDQEASSTFIVKRDSTRVEASVYGRNESPNTKVKGLKDRLRNFIVAIGSWFGPSKVQWKSLTTGLIKK